MRSPLSKASPRSRQQLRAESSEGRHTAAISVLLIAVCVLRRLCARSGRSQAATSLLDRRQGLLGLGERPGAEVDARRLGRDRDLLAGGGVAPLALLRGRLHPRGELNQSADPDLLGVAEFLEN